jgi:hypothetical protein
MRITDADNNISSSPRRQPPQAVAVKIPLNGRNYRDMKALLDELKVMTHIGHHVNVLQFIGGVTKYVARGRYKNTCEFRNKFNECR